MADEEYNRKMESLQQYIPFLDHMIAQLKDPNKKNREQQLSKMQSLHTMITDKKKKLKLDTLTRCEDVISKLYEKVHNRPLGQPKRSFDSPASTPASPSPTRDLIMPQPLTIPMERVDEPRIPRIDVYSSAAESLSKPQAYSGLTLRGKVPDMSRPPISLEDLKTLEDDVHDKIMGSSLHSASLNELSTLRDRLEQEIYIEDVKARSPQKSNKEESINTTVRNSLNLAKKIICSPDKSKAEEKSETTESPIASTSKIKDVMSPVENGVQATPPKKDNKITPIGSKVKPAKILKEPASIFGSILSNIDDQILVGKKKKEERRSSLSGRDEKRPSESKPGKSSDGDSNKKEERRSSIFKDEKKKSERRSSSDKSKSSKSKDKSSKDKHKSETKDKDVPKPAKDDKRAEKKEHTYSKEKVDKTTKDSLGSLLAKLEAKKEPESKEAKEEDPSKTSTFKRLADKYNPKPRKSTVEQDVDKAVADSIEEKMKITPPKIPFLSDIPVPPPVRLLPEKQEPPPPAPKQLPDVLQNILLPSTTQLINNVVSQLRQTNAEKETKMSNLPSPSLLSPPDNFISDYAREDNFVSEYVTEDFTRDDFTPNNIHMSDFSMHTHNNAHNVRQERLNFEPPPSTPDINQFAPTNQRFIPNAIADRFHDNFTPNRPFTPVNIPDRSFTPIPDRPFTPVPDRFQQQQQQPFNNFSKNVQMDLQPLDYYPPNAPVPSNQYNCGPPILSPEMPHFHNEQKSNFGMMPNHDNQNQYDDMRWRGEDNRPHWERRDQDHRMSRDPRTYREYRELRESRDPRVARDNRESRDPRIRDPRENRDKDHRDPRLNRAPPRDADQDRSRFREVREGRSQSRDFRPSRYDSKFDRMYSRSNRERSRSRSRSRSYAKETFVSPLDSLYSGKEEHKTGKGYGVQKFRIPKVKTEDEKDDECTKVTSTNDDSNEAPVQEDHVDTANDQDDESEDESKEKDAKVEDKTVEEVKEKVSSNEAEVTESEPPKLDKTDAIKAAQVTDIEAKPADQTILAQFFANLLGSQNKKDKKTALYSLISTFSDSFSQKELTKITKIIKASDDEEEGSSEEEEDVKTSEQKPDDEKDKEQPRKALGPQDDESEDGAVKGPKPKAKKRIRRISSGTSKDEGGKDEERPKSPERQSVEEEESVVVTVGERIKNRKRASITPTKPKKKCRTELDMLHEDIQDMFIRDGVLTASGKRMCRLLKDDPNALSTSQEQITSPEEPQKVRKKPGPKPKLKTPNAAEVRVMKSVRVLIPKMPDSVGSKEESTKMNLRKSARNTTYAESEDEEDILDVENLSHADESSVREDESEVDTSDTEKGKTWQSNDATHKTKGGKRKRSWASGIIPSTKKKKKKASVEETPTKTQSEGQSTETDLDKSFIEPDKDYFIDWSSSKTHDCKLCDYHGRFITMHYKSAHPQSEILSSRFSPPVAAEAVKDSACNLAKYESIVRNRGGARIQFCCRFCKFTSVVPPTLFFDHLTTHTGEHRHVCPICQFSASTAKTLNTHLLNFHHQGNKRVARKSYTQTILFGYMCGECNYVQMEKKNVEEHVNIFHLQKPVIYKVNMSTYLDPEVEKAAENEPIPSQSEELSELEKSDDNVLEKEQERKMPPPPQIKARQKPGPKCSKKAVKKPAKKKVEVENDSSDVTDQESTTTELESDTSEEKDSQVKPAQVNKKRATRVSVEDEPIVTGRSRRAAKDKAAEKLKTMMEASESPVKQKPNEDKPRSDENKAESAVKEVVASKEIVMSKEIVADEDIVTGKGKEVVSNAKEGIEPIAKSEEKIKPAIEVVVKKEIEMNVFTCKTDLLEENKKIEQERIQLMDELNKSVGSRSALNFVITLSDRLSNNQVIVKQEPRDEEVIPPVPDPPAVMPVLQPSAVAVKKPVLGPEDVQVSNPNFDVTQKNDKLITDMIEKLRGKLGSAFDEADALRLSMEDDYDSEGPPPLTHVNELVTVSPTDSCTESLLIGGLVKVIKNSQSVMFSCLVPPCAFTTKSKDSFQEHCKEAHRQSSLSITSTLCEMCGMEMVSTDDCTLLENLFKHTITEHADFLQEQVQEQPRKLRIRKLSGDALSVIKKDWEEEIDKSEKTDTKDENKSEPAVSDGSKEEVVTMAELEISDENPFPFKIAGVMSLAEPQPPPLAPIVKPNWQLSPGISGHLIVKEAKLTPAELLKPRKTQKALAKFVTNVGDLYKCPHYYCLFTSNYKEALERHLKTHKTDPDSMIPCVYCDMKTPWEHVPMHIDIRHSNCRFACSYCLYRAVLKEYVLLHQDKAHTSSDYSVIALPQLKAGKFAIADTKVDPKTLCEPYRCGCRMEFLFENEFKRHLHESHRLTYLTCGYKNCSSRVRASAMIHHWTASHGVSIYQCGYCNLSCNDVKKMYLHHALHHQGELPSIFIRLLKTMQEGLYLGYTPEAFSNMRKIASVPSNFLTENDSSQVQPSIPAKLPTTTYGSVKGVTAINKSALQIVTTLQPASPSQQSVLIPTNQPGGNRTFTFVSASSATTTPGNILILPSVTRGNTLSGIVMSQPKLITSVASPSKAVKVVSSLGYTTKPLVDVNIVPLQEETVVTPPTEVAQKDGENDSSIAPLEHVTVGEDDQTAVDESDAGEVDPLSLDVDLPDALKATGEASSGDESDSAKVDKSKETAKSGLMGYQLYRCAFCEISFSNSLDFKKHVTRSLTCRKNELTGKPFVCVHCGKNLKNPHVLLDHIQSHGILRFSCSLCGCKFPTANQARTHVKNRHNISQVSMTPLNSSRTNHDIDEYVLKPKSALQTSSTKETAASELASASPGHEYVYTPEQVDQIPRRHILSSIAKCALCSYSTKVRTNIVRHLQFHSEEKSVPDTAPVNPVPCLEKNEKMFDKMINMASSSHAQSRMGGAKPEAKEKEADNLPEFVPTHCRYVCCAQGCNYICPEEGNLRHHLIALHDSETSFTCVHCKASLTPTDADNLIKHFKLHGLQLYKCHYCNFVHNLKNKVEKHAGDAHLDAPVKVVTVRLLESEPKDAAEELAPSGAEAVPPATPKSNKPWRCCMCKHKSVSLEGIQSHVLDKHEMEAQFKCALCTYKSDDKETFTEHFKEAHVDCGMNIIYAYRKVEEDKEKEPETFDTTPLWQRDRPRVRHIRGILFDDSTPVLAKSPKKTPKATSTLASASPVPGPSGVKSVASPSPSKNSSNLDLAIESVVNGTADILNQESSSSVSDDFFVSVNKLFKESNGDEGDDNGVIVIDDEEDKDDVPMAKNKDNKNAPVAKNRAMKRKAPEVPGISKIAKTNDEVIDLETSGADTDDEFSERNLKLQFGNFGTPLTKQLKCPHCNMFKSKRISDFIYHLFKEMKVYRFKCKLCSDESITFRYMYNHVQEHKDKSQVCSEDIISLPPNRRLEAWIQIVIREQSVKILQNITPISNPRPYKQRNPVQCQHCEKTFATEHDRNEHTILHWSQKPFACDICKYEAYQAKDIENHLEETHLIQTKLALLQNTVARGPTVAEQLLISDEVHRKQITQRKESATTTTAKENEDPLLLTLLNESTADATSNDTPREVVDVVQEPLATSDEAPAATDDKSDDTDLHNSDLVIVTKTDSNVPSECDVFCCEYCPFMTGSEMLVLSHLSTVHSFMHIRFKILNRVGCEMNTNDFVGCMLCTEYGSEIKIRQHHLEKHDGQTFLMYRYTCALCDKKFLKISSMKMHFNRCHPGFAPKYFCHCKSGKGDRVTDTNAQGKLKRYKCPICDYCRTLHPNSINNVRSHLKQHFKAFTCGLCEDQKYKTRGDALGHFAKKHPGQPEHIVQDTQLCEEYQTTMLNIMRDAVPVEEAVAVKNTARKSTSAAHTRGDDEGYSFYGGNPEEVDLNKIMTSVEVNGMCLNMTAEKLSKIFDLNAQLVVEDCNVGINLSNVFDS